jgi:hypothetical protein
VRVSFSLLILVELLPITVPFYTISKSITKLNVYTVNCVVLINTYILWGGTQLSHITNIILSLIFLQQARWISSIYIITKWYQTMTILFWLDNPWTIVPQRVSLKSHFNVTHLSMTITLEPVICHIYIRTRHPSWLLTKMDLTFIYVCSFLQICK